MTNDYDSLALKLLGFEDMFSSIDELMMAVWGDAYEIRETKRKKAHTRRWNRWQAKRR